MEKELTVDVLTVEEEIQKDRDAFVKAWNDNDAEALAKCFTEDAVRVGFYGEKSRGRKEIEKAHQDVFERLHEPQIMFDKGETRKLGEDYVVWQGGFEIKKNTEPKRIKGYTVIVYKKEKDRWLIVEAHPRLVPEEVS